MGAMIEEKRKKNPYIIAVDFDGTHIRKKQIN